MTDGSATAWGARRLREISWSDPVPALEFARTMSGLDYLRAMADGSVPPPPISELLGMTIESVDVGEVAFSLEPHESHYNPIGVVHGGIICTLLDTVTGCAVHSTLAAGWAYTSIDLNVSYLRAVRLGSGPLRVTGRVVKGGRRVAFASGQAVDANGAVVATATSSLLITPPA